MKREPAFVLPLVAERLTAYAIERQNGTERHQPPGFISWQEQRRIWTEDILQGMAELDGLAPAPEWMDWYDQRLEAARGCAAVEPLPLAEQTALIRDLSRYVSALEAAGGDRRLQTAIVRDLLDDMAAHHPWNLVGNGLSPAREQAEDTLLRMTDRYSRALHSEPLTGFDLMARYADMCISEMADRYLNSQRREISEADHQAGPGQITELGESGIRVLKIEPGAAPEIVTMPNTLDAIQAAVGGYIEAITLDANAILVCNEEGKLSGLPANRQVGGDTIAGTFLIVGAEDGDFCALSDEDAAYYAEKFAQPVPSFDPPEEPAPWEFYVL